MATKMQNLRKNIQKSVWGIKLKLCRLVSNTSLYKILFFIAVAQALWLPAVAQALRLLWQLKVSIDL